ncbi:MAG: hypothetical protein R8G66_29385 [Cytophagales bacterium]|nr:hypothetical protein [Cytophagales bacterium]
MKTNLLLPLFVLLAMTLQAQDQSKFQYEPSVENPFGLPNPKAPPEIKDYDPLMGESHCKSVTRLPDQTWGDTTTMTWRYKYIMNGHAVQDETFKEDWTYAGSIRQYNADSAAWYVHYYSIPGIPSTLPSWEGGKTNDTTMILYRDNTAPNGMEGFYRITFSDISYDSFNWAGEWTSKDESIVYPLWYLFCEKKE